MSALASTAARRQSTAPAGRGRRPELRVVPPRRHAARYTALLVTLGALGIFGVVSLSALAAESAFAVRTLEGELAELTTRYEELTAEVAALESPGRIRDVAGRELGMIPAREPAFLVVDPVDGDGEPRRAVRASQVHGVLADPLKPIIGSSL